MENGKWKTENAEIFLIQNENVKFKIENGK